MGKSNEKINNETEGEKNPEADKVTEQLRKMAADAEGEYPHREVEKYRGPSNPSPSQTIEGKGGLRVDRLSPEAKDEIARNAFKFDGVDYREGDLVLCGGKLWSVKGIRGGKVSTETDWDLDPYGTTTKEVHQPPSLYLKSLEPGFSQTEEVKSGQALLERIDPTTIRRLEDLGKIHSLKEDALVEEVIYSKKELEEIAKAIRFEKVNMPEFKDHTKE